MPEISARRRINNLIRNLSNAESSLAKAPPHPAGDLPATPSKSQRRREQHERHHDENLTSQLERIVNFCAQQLLLFTVVVKLLLLVLGTRCRRWCRCF